jgi:phosphatidylglycerol lysyltransferase
MMLHQLEDDPRFDRTRALVLEHGWNATSYQLVNPGIAHWFSARGDAVVGYVDVPRVRVVAGAPVCAPERLPAVVEEFEAACTALRRRACYFGAEGRLDSLLRNSRHHSRVLLGGQPAWDPHGWPEIVRRRASLRAQFNRARNKGVEISLVGPASAAVSGPLRRILGEWLGTRGLPPLHFLVEPETLERLADRRVFVARRGDREIAFLVASPVPQRDGWLIEQIVRGREAVNGTNELLVDFAMRTFAAEDARYVTLGLSPLSPHVAPERVNPMWLRLLLGWVRLHGRRFYNFEGLDRFKAKFSPDRWEPVYAIAAEPRFSVRSLHAIAAAFSGGSPELLVARALWRAVRTEMRWLSRRLRGRH